MTTSTHSHLPRPPRELPAMRERQREAIRLAPLLAHGIDAGAERPTRAEPRARRVSDPDRHGSGA